MIVDSFFFLALLTSASGDSVIRQVEVAGAKLHIEIRQPVSDEKAEELVDWIESTAENVNLTYGRFPNPAAKIIVIPSQGSPWREDAAVTFGRVTRNRGETVELFVNVERPISEYYEDWTATHEFSHLMLPLLSQRYRWISEGFATYYQNVLMARAGRYTPEFAWQRLTDGFDRGRESRPELSPNQAAADGIGGARMKIYWSGAAIALLADIELRQRSGGSESLDTVLGQLQLCCLPSSRRWSGQDLFRKLDTFVDAPVFMPLYRKYADEAGFPSLESALRALGIEPGINGIKLQHEAPLADIRGEITSSR
jgi:predicted metalloprotease with PDZ domain